MPLASIVMPVYNSAETVADVIESVLSQTWQDFSLIVVDDGSTDNSSDVIGSFDDPRIILLENGENKGIEYSLNRGVKAADCGWVFRLDSDDQCAPSRLQTQLEYLKNNPQVWVLGSWAELLFDDGSVSLGVLPLQDEQIKARLLFHSSFFHPAVAIRRSLFDHVHYSAKYPRAEDYDLWCKFAANREASFYNLPDALIKYRISTQGVSLAGRSEQLASSQNVRKMFLHRLGVEADKPSMQLYQIMAEGRDCAENCENITAHAIEAFLGLLENLKKRCRDAGYSSQAALLNEIGPRFGLLAGKLKACNPICFELLRQSEFYQESAV